MIISLDCRGQVYAAVNHGQEGDAGIKAMAMSFSIRLIIISANLVLTAVALAVGSSMSNDMDVQMAEILAIEQKWLLGAAILYAVTFLASWRFKGTFSVSATRMLAWAIVAYVTLSHGIDVLGAYRSDISAVLGLAAGRLEYPILLGIRIRLLGLSCILAMALTAVAVGFESPDGSDDSV